MSTNQIFPIFLGICLVHCVLIFFIFFRGNNAQLKRKLWPPFVIGGGILFVGFIYLMSFQKEVLYFMVPAVILISVINIKATKFCDSCGKTLTNQYFISEAEFCPKCGEKLEANI